MRAQGRLQQSQASIPSVPWKYNARLYGRGLSKIAHSGGRAPARTGYNPSSKRRLPRIAALAAFLLKTLKTTLIPVSRVLKV
jgi:hypothetical protein